MSDVNPLSIIMVKNGSKGDKLLFRYPYEFDHVGNKVTVGRRRNPYAVPPKDGLQLSRSSVPSNIENGHLVGFSDKVLSNLFAVKTQLCGKKFELKVNDVRFVGHPILLQFPSGTQPATAKPHQSTILMLNIVFALRVNASHSIVDCYHNLSQRLGVAIRHEEQRCGYLSKEAKIMLSFHDEVALQPEDKRESPFQFILPKSELAKVLKHVYESLCTTGVVNLFINNWIEVTFCLPQKVYSLHNSELIVEPKALRKCLSSLRPYHTLLLMVEENELLESLSPDASPSLIKLIQVASPLKSLQQLAADADIALHHVFCLVGHLVYWAKATVIYPLCESNVYVLSPNATTHVSSQLATKFTEQFPKLSLLAVMSEFSLPISLSQKGDIMNLPQQQAQQVQMVVWMLQYRLLMQLHTFVYLVPTPQAANLLSTSDHLDHQQHQPHHHHVPDTSSSSNTININTSSSSIPEDGVKSSVKSILDSDGGSVASDEGLPSPSSVAAHSQGSVLSDDLFPRKHLQDCLPSELSQDEKDSIMSVPAASNPEDLRLFARLCPYFRGSNHLEEIMYYQNVRRSQLLALLDKFRPVLITCQHEDAAVAMFYRQRTK